MNRQIRKIVAAILGATLLITVALIVSLLCLSGDDMADYTQKTYEVTDDIVGLGITASDGDVKVMLTDKEKPYVVYLESSECGYDFRVISGILNIDRRFDTDSDSIYVPDDDDAEVCVYLPKSDYSELHFESSSGDLEIEGGIAFGTVRAFSDSGDIEFSGEAKTTLLARTNSGDVSLENARVGGVQIKSDSGDIEFESVAAEENIELRTNSGDISIERTTAKDIIAVSDSGKVKGLKK